LKKAAADAIGNSDSLQARHALIALAKNGDEDAVALLLELARNDPNLKVRTAAVQALGQIDSPKAALVQFLEGERP